MSPPPPPSRGLAFVGGMDDGRVCSVLSALGLSVARPIDPVLFPKAPLEIAVMDPAAFGFQGLRGLGAASERLAGTPVVVLSGPCERDTLVGYLELPGTRAIVARDQVASDRALAQAAAAIIGGPVFGLAPYLDDDAPQLETSIRGSEDRERVLAELSAFARLHGVRSRLVAIAIDIAEELITNALYDAPIDAEGRRTYAGVDRRQAVSSPEGARPELRAAVTRGELIIQVSDPFGSLETSTVKRYLTKALVRGPGQVDEKVGGAGLGLARVFALVDRVAIHVAAGTRSEVTAALSLRGARRAIGARPTGLVLAEGPAPG